MPYQAIKLTPGINTQATPTLNSTGFSAGNLLRWKQGFLERIGGWARLFQAACAGTVRAMHAYKDLALVNTLLIGSDGGFQLYGNGTLATAVIAKKTNMLSQFPGWLTTTVGSSLYTINDPGNGAAVGDTIIIPQFFSVGQTSGNAAYLPSGTYTVQSVADANNYRIQGPVAATVSETGGVPTYFTTTAGSSIVQARYRPTALYTVGGDFMVSASTNINNGTTYAGVNLLGKYKVTSIDAANGYVFFDSGQPAVASISSYEGNLSSIVGRVSYAQATVPTGRNWFLDNLGQNGVVCYDNSPIFLYNPPFSLTPVINPITTGPQINAGLFVAMPQAQIVAFGSEAAIGGGVQDPLLVRWCQVGDPTNWIAGGTSASQAGSFRLSRGSRIVGGVQAPQATLLWTDTDVWSMIYTGGQFVYSFTVIGSGCGLISPKARTTQGRNTYWMGQKTFWTFGDGGVQPLECPVWDQVFPLIDPANVSKCFAASNASFQEIMFFYPVVGGSGEADHYVKLNVQSNLWDYGTLTRSAWIDESVFGSPLGADGNNFVQQHERGYDADGTPMAGAFAQTGYANLSNGAEFLFVDRMIPDLKWLGAGGAVNLTVYTADHPGDPPTMHGPFPITSTTPEVAFRARARLLSMRLDWMPAAGYSARLGAPMARMAPAGRR